MEIDLSELLFSDSSEVNYIYDELDRQAEKSQRKWFFLINYKNCTILPDAWIAFSHRGKKLNIAHSLGTARYAIPDRTGNEILEKSKTDNFDPNLFESRDDALAELAKMKEDLEAKGHKFDAPARPIPGKAKPLHVGVHFPRHVHVRRHPSVCVLKTKPATTCRVAF